MNSANEHQIIDDTYQILEDLLTLLKGNIVKHHSKIYERSTTKTVEYSLIEKSEEYCLNLQALVEKHIHKCRKEQAETDLFRAVLTCNRCIVITMRLASSVGNLTPEEWHQWSDRIAKAGENFGILTQPTTHPDQILDKSIEVIGIDLATQKAMSPQDIDDPEVIKVGTERGYFTTNKRGDVILTGVGEILFKNYLDVL